jgi:hypothetical protein
MLSKQRWLRPKQPTVFYKGIAVNRIPVKIAVRAVAGQCVYSPLFPRTHAVSPAAWTGRMSMKTLRRHLSEEYRLIRDTAHETNSSCRNASNALVLIWPACAITISGPWKDDLWLERWRCHDAKGDVIAVRYADDCVVGFERANTLNFRRALRIDFHERLRGA